MIVLAAGGFAPAADAGGTKGAAKNDSAPAAYDFMRLVGEQWKLDRDATGGLAYINGTAGAMTRETNDTFSFPSAIRLDTGKAAGGEASIAFYLVKSKLQPLKGVPLVFRAKIKWLKGEGEIGGYMRAYSLDEKGDWKFVLAGSYVTFHGKKGTWDTYEIHCMVPPRQDVNAVDFYVGGRKTTDPLVFLMDGAVVEVEKPSGKTFASPFAAYSASKDASPLEIVRNGKAAAVIVTAEKPTPVVQYAIGELNEHLKLSTGVELPVVKEEEAPAGPVVHIGKTALTERLGLSPDCLPPDHWVVRRVGNALILSGGENKFNVPPRSMYPGQQPFGTLYAVYEFLERAVGVRWYWPGDVGRMVPRHEEGIVLRKVCWQGAPTFAVRIAFDCRHLDPRLRPEDPWIWWQRMRWGGIGDGAIANHAFGDWNRRFGDAHPEWFALQRDGKRLSSPTAQGGQSGHLCFTNPQVFQEVVAEKRALFDNNPTALFSNVMTGDSDDLHHCQCEKCQALLRPAAGPEGIHSYAMWSFVNAVAAEVRKTHPDRFINCCAYGNYSAVPQDVFFQPNVAVTIAGCLPTENPWRPDAKSAYVARLAAWSKKSSNLFLWEYWCGTRGAKGLHGAPAVFPHAIQEALLLERGRVKGRVIEMNFTDSNGMVRGGKWADWMFDALNAYTAYRLMWNLDQDVDQMLDEFYDKFYGPAGPWIRRFYEEMEAAYADPNTKGGPDCHWDWQTCWQNTYPPPLVKRVMGYLREAEQRTRGQEPYHSRAAWTLAGFVPFETASKAFTEGAGR
jgi:hypothetical protein